MYYHIIAFLTGVILDWIVGDPQGLPHPIRWIGNLISRLDKSLLGVVSEERNCKEEKIKGFILVIVVTLISAGITAVVICIAYKVNAVLGIAIEAVLTCYLLCARSLESESMRVYKALASGDTESARYAVSMIVGRDTAVLDDKGITKAAVETVAENTSDGIIAPLLYTFIGGPVLGMFYKSVNTMDSMVGYHNDRYENFGFFAAKLDDVMNYIPARISGILMVLSAFLLGKEYSGKRAWKVFARDRYKHKSPNSAQTESACAGALGVQLAGDAQYFGKIVKKPFIGDDTRSVETEDIKRACRLMYMTEMLCLVLCLFLYFLIVV